MKIRLVGGAMLSVVAPGPGRAVCLGRSSSQFTIGVELEAVQLVEGVGLPALRQLLLVGQSEAVVVGRLRERLHSDVEVEICLAAMLERAGFVLAGPALLLALPLPSPGTRLPPVGPALRNEHASQGAYDSQASDDNRHPDWS